MSRPRNLREFADAAIKRMDAATADLKALGFHRLGSTWVVEEEYPKEGHNK